MWLRATLALLSALLLAPAAAFAAPERAPALTATVAQAQVPARPQSASLDSEAPPGAPPHWLPNEEWVMQHWIPYDERRLYRLLGVSRGDVWRLLRDDTRAVADLARAKGWEPEELAQALVAPWRGRLREPARLALLERRALRTLTQGHLAQHLFFHSLHQDAIPDNARAIFGVTSRAEFAALRRSELSPLMICRLNGLSRGHAQTTAEATLRAKAAQGVRGQAIPAAQAERLLARQLRQVPRWLQQTRYNGPPPLRQPRGSEATASNYSANPALSGDGTRVVYESYEARLSDAKRRGEIGVVTRRGEDAPVAVRRPDAPARPTPASAYNPAVSADGRWVAFEAAEGNLNFAKRYGAMNVFLRDLSRARTREISPRLGGQARSAYNPTLSGDGRLLAYESSAARDGALDVYLADLRTGAQAAVEAPPGAGPDVYEPQLSANGRRLAFTALARDGRSAVFVRDLATGRTARASAPGEEAWEPALSRDGGVVAYTRAGAGGAGRAATAVVVRDEQAGTTTAVPAPWPRGSTAEPSLSADGSRLAFVARPALERRSQVFVHDLSSGATQLVSRATGVGGAAGAGSSGRPALSGDGRTVAFTSDAWNLSPGKCNSARGVFVRDLARAATRLVSLGDGANRYAGPTKGSSTSGDMYVALLCA